MEFILQILKSCHFGQSWHSQRPPELGWSARSGPPGTPLNREFETYAIGKEVSFQEYWSVSVIFSHES